MRLSSAFEVNRNDLGMPSPAWRLERQLERQLENYQGL